jgi:hypothetical protein
MILGMSTSAFTTLHVIISLIGILTGLVVAYEMLKGKDSSTWTAVFLATTVLTSVTGFFFPFTAFKPPHIFGVISLAVLAVALAAIYLYRLAGAWRWIYVSSTLFALYLNVFVGVVQAFQKVAPLSRLAPTQTEAPFLIAQAIVAALFVWIGVVAVRRFYPHALHSGIGGTTVNAKL